MAFEIYRASLRQIHRRAQSRRTRRRWLAAMVGATLLAGLSPDVPSVLADDCCPTVVLDLCPPCDPVVGSSIGPMLQTPTPVADGGISPMLQQPVPGAGVPDGPVEMSLSDINAGTPQSPAVSPPTPDPGANFSQPVTDQQAQNFNLGGSLARGGGAGAGQLALADTPNMMGDLLMGTKNSLFNYNLAGDGVEALSSGGAILRNSKVSENNSAIPRDRVSFRYHYFNNGASLNALQSTGETFEFDIFGEDPIIRDTVGPFKQEFDTHLFEFGFEKTFGPNMSLEVRLPFTSTLSPDLELLSTEALGSDFNDPNSFDPELFDPDFAGTFSGGGVLTAFPTPEGTLGDSEINFQDITLISKFVLLRNRNSVLTAGLAGVIPTGPDTSLFVSDGVTAPGFLQGDIDGGFQTTAGNPAIVDSLRFRSTSLEHNVGALTPYLAAAMMPSRRTFVNAFGSIEFPIGKQDVEYQEAYLSAFSGDFFDGSNSFTGNAGTVEIEGTEYQLNLSDVQRASIREQTLMSLDVAFGYWAYEAKSHRSRLRRVGLIAELHYVTTLNDADIATFNSVYPGGAGILVPDNAGGTQAESPFQLGNTANRLDILNTTLGMATQFGNNLTVNTGIALPLRGGDDKLFDYELQLQANYYPAGLNGRWGW